MAFDRQRLATIFPDAAEREEIVAQALGEICEQTDAIEAQLARDNLPAIAEAAHVIRGITANIGADEISACAGRLEECARSRTPGVRQCYGALREALDALCDE